MLTKEKILIDLFLKDLGVILILILIAVTAIFFASKNAEAYGQAIEMKMSLLEEATTTPKVILVGGSGLAFGIDSQKIKDELHLSPVNLGLYAGIGMGPLLSMVEKSAQHGDTVVMIPEYDLLQSDPYGSGFMHLEMLQSTLHFGTYLGTESIRRAILASPNWLKTRVISLTGRTLLTHWRKEDATLYRRVYRAKNFNHYGDMVGHLSEEHRLTKEEALPSTHNFVTPHMNMTTRNLLKQFIAHMNARGVHVYFSWQALPEMTAEKNADAQESIAREIAEVFGGKAVLGTQADFTYPEEAFFDTVNHLAGPAREDRTNHLIQVLRPVILTP